MIKQNPSFASRLLAKASPEALRSWASVNRGCFVLLSLLEHKDESLTGRVRDALQAELEALKLRETPGARNLVAKLEA